MTGPSYARPDDDRPGTPPQSVEAGAGGPDPYGDRTAPPSRSAAPGRVPERTRTGALWVSLISAVVVLLLLLIFILQNSQKVDINFFGADANVALGVALLLAAVLGALLVALAGAARVLQLRHTARRMAKSR